MKRLLDWIKRHPIITGIIALVTILILWGLLSSGGRDYEYVSEDASTGDVARVVSASGTLRALNTINVGAEVSGQITAVYVDFNSPVAAGQLLAEIDATRPRARVTQARAQVDLARASLAQAEASISRSTTDVDVQTREFARRTELSDKGFVSTAGLDQAENALVAAKAALSTAQAQAQSARAQIAQSMAELESARLDLSRTRIIAPTSGVVIDKLVEPGTTVAANFQTPNLFTIAADTSRMQVEASVDEADIGQVREAQQVRFTVDSYPDSEFEASVQQIRQSATQNGNAVSYLVILDVDNSDGRLLTGMTANVEIITGAKKDVLRVPVASTRFLPREEDRGEQPEGDDAQDGKQAYVWVPGEEPYAPSRVPVETGLEGEDYVEISGGLEAGQSVLVRSKSLRGDGSDEGS
ncbi:efflux RND transporter periplasmic adaptor subunit [uncultured Erythrobacter sp.]|uniref:efflux RND transporter periplasmic adaptor subunit n=1 Tax=uncultured Erythrobacter sp. TaxID=263913 RepID=UPI0026110720|nr:efflux RND transporter periplasmic adaptor subunit [uncultured Erythrobacter sp.]